ncbi:MAG: hypothetical protein GTN89_03190 [Acidobacteria bacterium]|nr:hypothetical protein [Acidobacteriota bacterium]NIM62709.1 hypothetical protein [Acidobacteriota bacterium]NIO58326.1 hypothetical protein [Acidobacteriota bacterium]NIQ29386.1 hypothetical protein [Acidobacteriota bacterium]NIQ87168.1 hypothetical protein [Acidobacteriota bacterium]
MRLLVLSLTILLALACAGEPEPAGETTPGSATETTPSSGSTESEPTEPTDLLGGAKLAKVRSAEWERVEGFTRQFYAGELDPLYASFSEGYKQEFSMQDLVGLRDKMLAEFGEEVEVVATRKEEREGYRAFFRAARFSADERLIEVAFLIGPDDSIAGLFVTPDRTAESPAR